MNKKEIKQILSYVERMEDEPGLKYELDEEGFWGVISGEDRMYIGFYQGRFVDALYHGMKLPEFGGDWTSLDTLNNTRHGYIKKITPKKLAEKVRVRELFDYQDALGKVEDLEEKLKAAKKKI